MLRSAEDQPSEAVCWERSEELAGDVAPSSDRRRVESIAAGEHSDTDALASLPEQLDSLAGLVVEPIRLAAQYHEILRAADVAGPLAARLHHDERHRRHAHVPLGSSLPRMPRPAPHAE
jgi:hypothetical protein